MSSSDPPPRADAREDDRVLTERCFNWCRILWLPEESCDYASAGTDIPWDSLHWKLPWGGSFKDLAEQYAKKSITDAKVELNRKRDTIKEALTPESSEHIPQMHELSLREETLKKLSQTIMHAYHLTHPLTGASLIRFYTFYSILCELGQQPFNVASTVGRVLYDLRYDQLTGIFDGGLTVDSKQASRWWKNRRELEVKNLFPDGPLWQLRSRHFMREARPEEEGHMQYVLKELSGDLSIPPLPRTEHTIPPLPPKRDDTPHKDYFDVIVPHTKYFDAAYEAVLEAEEIIRWVSRHRLENDERDGATKKLPHYRRYHKIERIAEHLVVCPVCGGIPRLLERKLRLKLPDYPFLET